MILSLRASSSRLPQTLVSLTHARPVRPFSVSSIAREKLPLRPSKYAAEPMELLTMIGRNADKALSEQAKTWDTLTELWFKGSEKIEEIGGLSPKERKYVLYCLNQYSKNVPPKDFIRKPRTKKFRGWGPAIQKGFRVRGLGMKPVA